MVQQYSSPVRIYPHAFELVMAAYEKRFPTCHMIPAFLGSDIIEEIKSEDGAQHTVKRRCRLNVEVPWALKKIAGIDFVLFIQENALDRAARTLKITAYNESWASRVKILETCEYFVHPENPSFTCFEQKASLDIISFFGFESTLEKVAIKQYTANINKGKEIIEYYLKELIDSGVTHVEPWGRPVVDNDSAYVDGTTEEVELAGDDDSDGLTFRLSAQLNTSVELVGESRLSDDYIHRWIGNLSASQESALVRLRELLHENANQKGKIPSDAVILKFLIAREFHVERAKEMLCHSLAWRKMNGVDRLLSTGYKPDTVITDYYPGGWIGSDRGGRPVYILCLGKMDVKGVLKAVGEAALTTHIIATEEEGIRKCSLATQEAGHPITQTTFILDLDSLSMRHLWRPGVKFLLKIIQLLQDNYPETMGRLLIVRAPRLFPVLWTLVSSFIDDATRNKFVVYTDDYLEEGGITHFIDKASIPTFLGGEHVFSQGDEGVVPRTLYRFDDFDEQLDETSADTLYKRANPCTHYPHEVMLHALSQNSIVTWDFDILKGSVEFQLLHVPHIITEPFHIHHCTSGSAGGAHETTQYINTKWRLDEEFKRIENPQVFKDGDSVQGSHLVESVGTFVLQWRCVDESESALPRIAATRSRIMYYAELIKSEDYKGSMTSLQSVSSSGAFSGLVSPSPGSSCSAKAISSSTPTAATSSANTQQ